MQKGWTVVAYHNKSWDYPFPEAQHSSFFVQFLKLEVRPGQTTISQINVLHYSLPFSCSSSTHQTWPSTCPPIPTCKKESFCFDWSLHTCNPYRICYFAGHRSLSFTAMSKEFKITRTRRTRPPTLQHLPHHHHSVFGSTQFIRSSLCFKSAQAICMLSIVMGY